MEANHDRANRCVLSEAEVEVKRARIEARVRVPDALRWRTVIVRVYVANERADAMGAQAIVREEAAVNP